jgi:hypothetical protein
VIDRLCVSSLWFGGFLGGLAIFIVWIARGYVGLVILCSVAGGADPLASGVYGVAGRDAKVAN